MSFKSEWVRFGEFSGYLSYEERTVAPAPAVIVIQEAWGVDGHIEDVTRRIAQAGYVALAPDLFARYGARPVPLSRERVSAFVAFFNTLPPGAWMVPEQRDLALASRPEVERAELLETMTAIFAAAQSDEHIVPLVAAARWLRETCAVSKGGRVGAIGFGMGGRLSALLAGSNAGLSCAAIFYGMPLTEEKAKHVTCPLLGFYGDRDSRITDSVPGFAAIIEKHGKTFDRVVYAGAEHAFYNDTRPAYHAGAARDSTVRLLAFFKNNLVVRADGDATSVRPRPLP